MSSKVGIDITDILPIDSSTRSQGLMAHLSPARNNPEFEGTPVPPPWSEGFSRGHITFTRQWNPHPGVIVYRMEFDETK